MRRRIFKTLGAAGIALFFGACSTTAGGGQSPIITPPPAQTQPGPQPAPGPDGGPDSSSDTGPQTPSPKPDVTKPSLPTPAPIAEDTTQTLSEFDQLVGWNTSDMRGALAALRRACLVWGGRDESSFLNENLPHYGRISDWSNACFAADYASDDAGSARRFFEQYFLPAAMMAEAGDTGLLTGYYEPEISVRARKDAVYSEPILETPSSETAQNLPRAQINATTAPVIAYGKPIDVFFMQVQGSGRIGFPDGRSMRAAYAANNGKPYKSIGAALVRRGEMTLEQASKQSIEAWMMRNGPAATRALMNENPRYIFFKTETVAPGEGPKGAMGTPLETMATMAVDNRYHPYGSLVWIETTLPQYPGDYKGAPASLLVSAQDTGSAIKGPIRGDLFFGTGDTAGELAGVMKHPVKFTLLLPAALAMRYLAVS